VLGSVLISIIFILLAGCGNLQQGAINSPTGTIPAFSTTSALSEFNPSPTASRIAAPPQTPTADPSAAKSSEITSTPEEVNLPIASTTIPPSPSNTMMPSATNTLTPTTAPQPTATPFITPTATLSYVPIEVNGIAPASFIIMPENVRQNVHEIYALGQSLGRNPHAFSKLGDSVTLTDHFLARFDSGHYVLGPYDYLQPTIDHYGGSFSRYGVATKVGLHAWSIFDPLWASKDWCLPEEHMVACEIRLFNPSIVLVKIGSNDNGAAEAFDKNVRQLVEYLTNNGVIPVLATKADRFEGPDDRNNKMLRQIAAEYEIPLWDYDRIAETLPRRGLSGDDVHMTMADANDYTDPVTFERGYPVSDLTAVMMLHSILEEVMSGSES
jgi:hypothetical protein